MRFVIGIIVLVAIGVGGYFLFGGEGFSRMSNLMSATAVVPSTLTSDIPYTGAPLTKEYKNDRLGFSVSMPEDFNAQELMADENGGMPIIIQNASGEGVQIYVTQGQGDARMITANDVRASISDMQVSDEEVVEIGSEHRGVAFKSDNEAFGGASREVWFFFRGNLYQISTYDHLDPLLKAMFSTWKFF
ncbi:MAG: hypothetical protein WA021_01735 [Minisyncoccia bacterium]